MRVPLASAVFEPPVGRPAWATDLLASPTSSAGEPVSELLGMEAR